MNSSTPRDSALLARILAVPPEDRDAWLDDLLGIEEAPPDVGLPKGGVPYLPSGVAEILRAVRDVPVRADDAFVDLGSGVGRVVMLAHLLTGARSLGVEIQPPLVAAARRRAAALGLDAVSFVQANAAEIELDGSVFYLYAPFNGALRREVLRRLEDVARRRAIVVCAVDLDLDETPWLRARPTDDLALSIYDSTMPGVPRRSPR